MAKHTGKTFKDQQVAIDGDSFEKCKFDRCRIVYSGGDHTSMSHCVFENGCAFELDGAAARTMAYLQGLYHHMGAGGMRLVEDTFNNIRRGVQPKLPPVEEESSPFN